MPFINGIELPEPGGDRQTWGDKLNDKTFASLVNLIDGVGTIALNGDYALLNTNGLVGAEARLGALTFTDNGLTAVPTVTMPGATKITIVRNAGATHAIIFTAGGLTSTLPAGRAGVLLCDGTNVEIIDFVALAGAASTAAQIAQTAAEDAADQATMDAGAASGAASSARRESAKAKLSADEAQTNAGLIDPDNLTMDSYFLGVM